MKISEYFDLHGPHRLVPFQLSKLVTALVTVAICLGTVEISQEINHAWQLDGSNFISETETPINSMSTNSSRSRFENFSKFDH